MDPRTSQDQDNSSQDLTGGFAEASAFDLDKFVVNGFPLAVHAEAAHKRRQEVMGEYALVCATLEDAIATYQKYIFGTGRRAKRLFNEVEEWFFMDDWLWPFSFLNICEILELDPESIRRGLGNWREHAIRVQAVKARPSKSDEYNGRQKKRRAA